MVRRGRDRKAEELAKTRTLNPHPEAVLDGLRLLGLLRRCRSGAGQVRDGAPGRGRRDCGEGRSAFVRFLAAVLLHGGRGVGLRRAARPGAGQARPAAGPQAQRTGPGSSGLTAIGGPDAAHQAVGAGGGGTVRHHRASPLGGTSAGPPGVRPESEKRLSRPPTTLPAAALKPRAWPPATSSCVSGSWPDDPMGGGWATRCWPAKGWWPGSARGPPSRRHRLQGPTHPTCPPPLRPRPCPPPRPLQVRIPPLGCRPCPTPGNSSPSSPRWRSRTPEPCRVAALACLTARARPDPTSSEGNH